MLTAGSDVLPAVVITRRCASVLLAAVAMMIVALIPAARSQPFKPPIRLSAAPPTNVASLRAQSAVLTATLRTDNNTDESYKRYLFGFKKIALPEVDPTRKEIYLKNLEHIELLNSNTKLTRVATCNKFTDATSEELQAMLGLNWQNSKQAESTLFKQLDEESRNRKNPPEASPHSSLQSGIDASSVPDWSMVIPTVKRQGNCGCCWAFASACLTEAAHFINTNQVISLSEQQLVDCNNDNNGCHGGWYDQAFDYIKSNGLTFGSLYPYEAQKKETCPAARFETSASRLESYVALASANEDGMLQALNDGPIAVAVTVDDHWFRYGGGVFTSDTCTGNVNHAVVVVGAGVDYDTKSPYWLVRNSWGPDWGENGYIRIARGSYAGSTGMCNIARNPYQVKSADILGGIPTPTLQERCKATTYVVQSLDDTLSSVAAKFNTTVSQLIVDNNLHTATAVAVGQKLTIKCPTGHTSMQKQPDRVESSYTPQGSNTNNDGPVGTGSGPTSPANGDTNSQNALSFSANLANNGYVSVGMRTGSSWASMVSVICTSGPACAIEGNLGVNPAGGGDAVISPAVLDRQAPPQLHQLIGANSPSGSPPNNECTTTTYMYKSTDTLSAVAVKFQTTISQIMLDNKLNTSSALVGQALTITCPVGNWSEPYGVWGNKASDALVQIPTVAVCPAGQYAVSFYVKPSEHHRSPTKTSAWVGTITMTCSGGSNFTIDAQPGVRNDWPDGTISQPTGFVSVPVQAGWAIDSLFGVGTRSGDEVLFNCPPDTVVTGLAGGASPILYPLAGWLANLQFLCQNPFNSLPKLQALRLRSSAFATVAAGLSCNVTVAGTGDTWFTVAHTNSVDVVELMRANQAIDRSLMPGDKLFLPPCHGGVFAGTKVSGTAST